MLLAKQSVPSTLTMPSREVRFLRAKLILEEAIETVVALGFTVDENCNVCDEDYFTPDLVQIADGCADLSVVTTGTLSVCGIPDEPLLRLVDENNLIKFGPGGYLRNDGKWIKPPTHRPPDIEAFLQTLKT